MAQWPNPQATAGFAQNWAQKLSFKKPSQSLQKILKVGFKPNLQPF
jgi:hypothetical protein